MNIIKNKKIYRTEMIMEKTQYIMVIHILN